MKNQYFGNKRDFYKYDLLLDLMEGVPGLRSLTYVPMLTPSDQTAQGALTTHRRGTRRDAVHEFLRICLGRAERGITNLREFFAGGPFAYQPYRDEEIFRHESRAAYFGAGSHIPHSRCAVSI